MTCDIQTERSEIPIKKNILQKKQTACNFSTMTCDIQTERSEIPIKKNN
jgi:hypothetical protein